LRKKLSKGNRTGKKIEKVPQAVIYYNEADFARTREKMVNLSETHFLIWKTPLASNTSERKEDRYRRQKAAPAEQISSCLLRRKGT